MNKPVVSIVIPTYKDWPRLRLCLNAIANQTYESSLYEVIVVNNADGDEKPDTLIPPHNCIIINVKKAGSYAARNAALKICTGEIIGFTDSDCIPDQNWILNAVNYFDNNKAVQRIGGIVKVFSKKNKPSTVELYDTMYAFPQEKYVQDGVSVTANMFTYKKVFEAVGTFNENEMSGGDFEWGKRANATGYKIGFSKDIIVNHPARDSYKELIKKAIRVGKGQLSYTKQSKPLVKQIPGIIKLLRPKIWEIKRIYQNGAHLSNYDKISLIILRHLVLWSKDFARIKHQTKRL